MPYFHDIYTIYNMAQTKKATVWQAEFTTIVHRIRKIVLTYIYI